MKIEPASIEYLPLREADIKTIKAIEVEYNLAPWTLEDYYQEIKREDSMAYTAKHIGKTIGYLVARLIRFNNHNINSSYKTIYEYEMEVYNICVISRYRRNQIGKNLIYNAIAQSSQRISSIWLEVRKSNIKALCFYENLNFKVVGHRKDLYSNPQEDGLLLKLEVN